jgi:hypothetical protein
MNTHKTSMLKTVLEYLGRGATPVDGYHWIDTQRAPGVTKAAKSDLVVKNDAYWADVAEKSALCPRNGFSASARRFSASGSRC